MKRVLVLCCLLAGLPVAAYANDKIDPATYICAELVTQPMTDGGQAPSFEALQIDGFASAKSGNPVADPETFAPMLGQVYAACETKPTATALSVWQEARKTFPVTENETSWRADKALCKDYTANPDNGSGFVIWLDAYNRGATGTTGSVLVSDDVLKTYLESCARQPDALMLNVLRESVK